jgi:hypothetical protein
LKQNYPNPFNSDTTISYSIPTAGKVRLELFNIPGAKVKNISEGTQNAGTYSVNLNAAGLPNGIYFTVW